MVVGIRPTTLHPASERPDLPTFTAKVELIEALGSESMAYFRDRGQGRAERGRRRRRTRSPAPRAASVTGRPNLVASFPPHVQPQGRPGRPDRRRRRRASTSSTRRRVRRFARRSTVALALAAALVAVAGGDRRRGRTRRPRPRPAGPSSPRSPRPPVYAPIASERIYFVMTDRYANGDPSNDRGGLSGGPSATGYDPTDPGYFHGGDLKGLTGDCTDPTHGPRADQARSASTRSGSRRRSAR